MTKTARGSRTLRLLAASAAGVALLGATAACADSSDDRTPEKKTFALDGRILTVDAADSSVVLRPADVKDIRVTRWFDAWSVGGSTKTSWSLDGNTLKLRVKCSGVVTGCSARHEVLVPRGVSVTVVNSDGKVEASGFDTPLKVSTKDGSVVVRDVTGALDLSSKDGKVDAAGVSSPRVTAHSSDGSVNLRFTAVPDRVQATSSDGKVIIELPDDRYRVFATASDGKVTVTVPRDDASDHEVTVHSDDGSVTVRPAA